jgi:hypothetical protein
MGAGSRIPKLFPSGTFMAQLGSVCGVGEDALPEIFRMRVVEGVEI